MMKSNDKKLRQELVRRYLNAETTLEEERLLADLLCDTDIALSAEEEDARLMLHPSDYIGQSEISAEKADEFDRLMAGTPKKHGKAISPYWLIPTAAAAIVAFVCLPHGRKSEIGDEHPGAGMSIMEMTKAANFQNEQVESYQLRPAGDATIVTKTCSDGTSSSYIICTSDEGNSCQIVPLTGM